MYLQNENAMCGERHVTKSYISGSLARVMSAGTTRVPINVSFNPRTSNCKQRTYMSGAEHCGWRFNHNCCSFEGNAILLTTFLV